MLRLLPAAVLAVAALAASSSVLAQAAYQPAGPIASALTPGATYVALNAGTSDLSRPITAFGLFGGTQQGSSYGVAIGNFMANQNYGFEVGYTDFGSVNRYGGSTKVDGINLSLIGRMPLSASFNLLGKVGTTYSRTDVSANAANSNMAGSERGFDWSYGLGGELKLAPQWSATLQYDEHFVKYAVTGSERVSATTLGLRYYY
ncbi:MAG: outer membrane beta-barrel protein [Rhodoferax sp.]|nr:outer membrane beta-barrel protein [Rhodoferax sp.]